MPRVSPSRNQDAKQSDSAELVASILPRLPDRVTSNTYELIYRQLRRYVVTQRIPPGTRLLEKEIAGALGTSRTPVRDALRRLEADGLAVRDGKGLVAASITGEGIRELMQLRAGLEVVAVEQAMGKATSAELDRLVTMVTGLESELASPKIDPDEFNETHLEIHRAIFRLAFDPSLESLVMSHVMVFVELATQYRSTYLRARDAAGPSHENIVRAMAEGDVAAATGMVHSHVDAGVTYR